MGKGLCKLCEKNSVLLKSHVLPKFAYKWMKETSGSGHIRFGVNPNQRSQDGFKLPWLCEACEIKLNNWETEFANKIFHPLNNGKVGTIKYDEWLNLFCISVSWRVLNFYLEQNLLSNYPPNIQKSIIEAIENWRLYLLGQSKSLQKFEMDFFPLKPVTSIDGYPLEEIPANLNVYMLRNIDMDVAFNDDYSFVYVKLGPYIILGIIQLPKSTSDHFNVNISVGHWPLAKGAQNVANQEAPSVRLDVLAGGRLWYLDQETDIRQAPPPLPNSISGDETWFDFIVGSRVFLSATEKLNFWVRTDIGGFGLGFSSDFSWNLISGINYEFPYGIDLGLGYRFMYDKYDDGSGDNRVLFDNWIHGPIIKLGIVF